MQCALGSTNSNTEKVSDGGSCSLSRKCLEQNNYKASSKDREVSALIWRNSDQRYFILFVTLEPDAHWKFVAPLPLPLQGPDQRNHSASGVNVNMDRLDLVSPPPVISFPVDQQRAQRSHPPDPSCSAKFITSSVFRSNVLGHSRNRGSVNRRTKVAKVSGSSSQQNSFISSDSSAFIHDDSNATSSADLVKDMSKVDKPVKRSSRRKAKKKGKQSKKPSCNTDSGLQAFCEEGAPGSSVSETCANNGLAWGEGPISENKLSENAMAPAVSLLEITVDKNDCEDNSNCIINHSATPTMVTSYSDGVDSSETVVSSVSQNFAGEDFVINSANGIQTTDLVLSTFNGEVADTHLKQSSYCNDISSEVVSDAHSVPMLDSVSDGWNSDDSTNAGDDIEEKSSVKEDNGSNLSEPSGYSNYGTSLRDPGKRYFSHGNFSKGVVDADRYAERAKCSSQGCSSSDLHLAIPGKKGRQGSKFSGSSSGMHRFGSSGNVQGRMGKENNHSVWQKVRRNDVDECICEVNDANPVGSQFDIASKEASFLKRVSNVVDSDVSLKSKDDKYSKVKVSEKLKRKPSKGSKQEYNYHGRKGPQASKTNSIRATKRNMQLKEASEISSQVNHHKGFTTGSRSHFYIDSPRVGLSQTDTVDCSPSNPVQNSQVCLDEKKPLGSIGSAVSNMNDQAAQNQSSPSSRTSDSLDQTHLLEVRSRGDFHHSLSNGPAKLETEASPAEYGKQDHNSGSFLQKWIPVVRKDEGVISTSRSDNLLVSRLDESVADGCNLKNIEEEILSSNAHSFVPSMDPVAACMGSSSGDVNGPPSKDKDEVQKLRYNNTCISKEHSRTHAVANCLLTHESKEQNLSLFETDSNKIALAVNDAYRIQLASEGVQLVTGSPLAEFERLLHSASPVLGRTHSLQHCRSCSRDQLIGASLCRHEIPNISLGSLWQWYEKHGSYGLEVRAEDYQNSKRMGMDRFEFRAYFVPFLSAVQLFGNSSSHSMNICNRIPSTDVLKACDTSKSTDNSSDIGNLPIFSVLLPQPRRENTTSPPVHSLYTSESSSASGQDEFYSHSLSTTCFGDSKLLFEYFESEQPQQRQPLFEKIKELIRGDGPSNRQAYGDPTKLDSLDLHDLHPASWYSVAWYPIYRIPDGNFRAAFLTYHSLGHLIHRSTLSDSTGGDTCIVSPVVGLQSYNAQAECWFQLRHLKAIQTEETLSFNRSEILKERLRTLEQSASVMARAVVSKGNLRSVNRQADYEFFLSRRRW